jgi:hypothetical protein
MYEKSAPDAFVKKLPKMKPNPFFVKINAYLLPRKKVAKLFVLCNFRKTTQSNQSPKGRKFAQSGHPGLQPEPIF